MKKTCRKCNVEYDATPENFAPQKRNSDNLQTYCRKCNYKMSSINKGKKRGSMWAVEGYANPDEHYNAALKHYAEIFNCPKLLKHVIN